MNLIPEIPEQPTAADPQKASDNNPMGAEPQLSAESPAEPTPEFQAEASIPVTDSQQPEETPLPGAVLPNAPVRRRRSPLVWIVPAFLLLVILAAVGGFIWLRSYESSALKQGQDALQASQWGVAESAVDQALQYRSTGLLANPVQLVLVRGEARYHMGKADLAMADLEEGKAVDPASAKPYLLQAHIQYEGGKMDKALQYAGEAQKRDDKIGFPYDLQALQAFQQRDYAGALTLANKTIERDPALCDPFFIRGVIFSMQGNAQAATKDLDQALTLNPNNAEALAWRAFTNYQDDKKQNALQDAASATAAAPTSPAGLWGLALTDLINYKRDDAFAVINQAIAVDSDPPELYLTRGLSYHKAANFKDEQADYDKALQIAPDFVFAIYSKASGLLGYNENEGAEDSANHIQKINPQSGLAGILLSVQGFNQSDLKKAVEQVTQALTLAPDDSQALITRGNIYTFQKEYAKASADCNKALEIWPNSNGALICLSDIEFGQKNYDLSIARLDEVLKINPQNADAMGAKAGILLTKKDNDGAKTVLEAALKIDPESPYLLKVHSAWANAMKDNLQATSDLNKALGNSPKDTQLILARGGIYLEEGNTDRAAEDAQAALAINSRLPDAYHLLFLIDMKLDKKLDALANAKKLAEMDPTNPMPYTDLGMVYQASGNNELAITNLQKSLEIEPDNIAALSILAQAHQDTGDYAAAVKDFDSLLALKSQLTTEQITLAQQTRDFFVTIPAAVNGQRATTNTDFNFSITYPANWIPQPITTKNTGLLLKKTDSAKIVTSSFGILFSPLDPTTDDALLTPAMLGDYVSQSMAKNSSAYKFGSRKPFQTKSLTGIVDTFVDKIAGATSGTTQQVSVKYYIFKSKTDFIICEFYDSSGDFATMSDEVDLIVKSLEVVNK